MVTERPFGFRLSAEEYDRLMRELREILDEATERIGGIERRLAMFEGSAGVSLLVRLAVYGSTLALGVLVVVLDHSPGFWEWLVRWWS